MHSPRLILANNDDHRMFEPSEHPCETLRDMSGSKKKRKHLVRLRTKQHRLLAPTDFTIPELNLDRVPQLTKARRTERLIRALAEAVLDEPTRAYVTACKAKRERAELALVFRAVQLVDRHGRFSGALATAERALGQLPVRPDLTNEIERNLEAYAFLVAAADWVADNDVGHVENTL